jgi:hypothetical protein
MRELAGIQFYRSANKQKNAFALGAAGKTHSSKMKRLFG